MTNLLIAYPDIPRTAVALSSTHAFSEDQPLFNSFGPSRYTKARLASAATGAKQVGYDVGSGVTATANYFILGRADLLKAGGITSVKLKGNNAAFDYASATTVYQDLSFSSSTLYGPNSADYVATFATSTAYRYWFVSFDSGASSFDNVLSSIYFGMALDLGCDPDFAPRRIPHADPETLRMSGTRSLQRVGETQYRFQFSWPKVTNANLLAFEEKIARYGKRFSVFLFTTAQHQILDSQRIVQASLESHSFAKVKDNYNSLTAEFYEELG